MLEGQQRADRPVLDAPHPHFPADAQRPIEEPPPERGQLGAGVGDPTRHAFVQSWHTRHYGRLRIGHVALNRKEAAGVGDLGPRGQGEVQADQPLEHVGEGKERQEAVGVADWDAPQDGESVAHKVRMAQHGALGFAGGA